MYKLMALIFCILFIPISAVAWEGGLVSFNLSNNTDSTAVYTIFWIDHPYRDKNPTPMPIAGGEVKPHSVFDLSSKYPLGTYMIWWAYSDANRKIVFSSKMSVEFDREVIVNSTPHKTKFSYVE